MRDYNSDKTPEGLAAGEPLGDDPVMTLTMVWTLEAVTAPALAMVEGNTVSAFCSAAASVCACAVAWDTCMCWCDLRAACFCYL